MAAPIDRSNRVAVFVGTKIQEKISRSIIPALQMSPEIAQVSIISLNSYYQFGISLEGIRSSKEMWRLPLPPWYGRSKGLKLISLAPFLLQVAALSKQYMNFLFFVDTGLLERGAIKLLNLLGCRTIVLQDAMKRKPRLGKPGALTWFGGGNASQYLIMGQRYISMIENQSFLIVGSPVFANTVESISPGKKILVVNQCFARYRETTEEEEFNFVRDVVDLASDYGQVELRLHPHNRRALYEPLCKNGVELSKEKPLSQSLQDAGIVLAVNSTVILEAAVLGRPVLVLDWHPSPYELPVQDIDTRCSDLDEMTSMLARWCEGDKTIIPGSDLVQAEIQRLIAYSGKESQLRITRAIEGIVRGD